ncbi:MAG: nitrilase-related carbon-nitrogen hydrolase, partial [Anaerolineae bacterium]
MTHSLFTRSSLGFARVAAVSPEMRVADCAFNTQAIIAALRQAKERGAQLVAFPELCITGYTCGDLFFQTTLLDGARAGLERIAEETRKLNAACVVGLPILQSGRLYNCAAFVCAGRVMGLVPKTYLPTYNEFYEGRWFTSASGMAIGQMELAGGAVPIGPRQIFEAANMPGCAVGIEICEDVWAVNPPSGELALAGATLIVNPSASPETLGKMEYRRELVKQQSARCLAAYVYAGSGPGESSSDLVFSGHSLICENGTMLAESARFEFGAQIILADVDLGR